jgi:phenylacetate-CoA ligase
MDAKKAVLNNIVNLPTPVSHALLKMNVFPHLVYGADYARYREFLTRNLMSYDATQLLINAVNAAIRDVPYYNKRYHGVEIRSVAEFDQTLALIDKDTVLDNYDDFINPQVNLRNYDFGTTGGTSGKPMKLVAPKNRYVVELATMHDMWSRVGYNFDVRAVIRNHRLSDDLIYTINPITREVIFDGFRLDQDYFESIYQVIKRMHVPFVHAYPSAAYEFSRFLRDRGYDPSFIRAFLSGSENIFDYQIDLIERRLGIRFFNWYGHSEKLILAGYCQKGNLYHVEPTYGYFELVDEENRMIREPGSTGEMVGTSFHNPGMPLIRYRTGDFAEYVSDHCPACGRRVTILKNIKGRWSGDKIFNSDGSFVTTTALNLHSELYSVINGMQYVQERKGDLRVLVVRSPEFRDGHEAALYRHFREKLKPETTITIEYVDRLRRQPNGKFLHIISKVQG